MVLSQKSSLVMDVSSSTVQEEINNSPPRGKPIVIINMGSQDYLSSNQEESKNFI
jgi:hypothetical protein